MRNFCLAVLVLIIVLLAICFVYNFICSRNQNDETVSYGERVTVNGHSMNVTIEGEQGETIVLLTGYGTAAPALDFKNLAEELKSEYRVVTVEPFGYGLSDVTDEERTIEAMTEELHLCLQELGIDTYILAGHSIAGVYGLYYIQEYGEEVTGHDSWIREHENMITGLTSSNHQRRAGYHRKVRDGTYAADSQLQSVRGRGIPFCQSEI